MPIAVCDSDADDRADLAIVQGVEIGAVDQPAGYSALVSGFCHDNCSTTGDKERRVQGSTIRVTIYTSKPGDYLCEPILTPFAEQIRLDVDGLSPGSIR